ncbi:hypothetical protein L202_04529 [Cryptococcus amylolentus CBS 6039]|uniref:RING-type E3 ubiquitin transferase n=1 Tax=Cryptococcus amylolentus CBS 6039 TaxID=1295533 RepID=A0A1E3HRQ1_9TREE|nr:hypothetical protein L202_04529 [Cryptococcus amylolentus CBS 6039]ODN79024.1 hypothetical protein L202_04529 [Cryptococcus amylolentus CBS 6039]
MFPGTFKIQLYGLLLASLALRCAAYIPAVAINDTDGLNLTDSSTIDIAWTDPSGVYSGQVSFQLQADVLTGGTTSGALVHFAESTMGSNVSTTTPWIAFISCDRNESVASDEWDVFTLARDRGAVSALLYTINSKSCLLNTEYITDFEKPLDVFATRTVQVARVINNQFVHTNDSFQNFNSTLLNDSATDVNNSLSGNSASSKTYLTATLTARNSTGQATSSSIPNSPSSTSSSSSGGKKKTSAGMIVLYAITGVVASMFLMMLVMGARRALRQGRRGGPVGEGWGEGGETGGGGQGKAAGLAQAILDTFPVIQFHRAGGGGGGAGGREEGAGGGEGRGRKKVDDEESLAMTQVDRDDSKVGVVAEQYHHPPAESRIEHDNSLHTTDNISLSTLPIPIAASSSTTGFQTTHETSTSTSILDSPSALAVGEGKGETGGKGEKEEEEQHCPICLVEFEDGDDLRVLPCERTHMYHRGCIDPWLLRVSASCPLCRKDFNHPSSPSGTPTPTTPSFPISNPIPTLPDSISGAGGEEPPTQHGFARYLAFMRRSRRPRQYYSLTSFFEHQSGVGSEGMSPPLGRTQRRERARERERTASGLSFMSNGGVGPGRSREADQNGPGGY